MTPLQTLRILGPELLVDVRFRSIRGRWIASADTELGPTLGLGLEPLDAIAEALQGVDGVGWDLRDVLPDERFFLY